MSKSKIDYSTWLFFLLFLLVFAIGTYFVYIETSNKIMLHEYLKNNGGK